MLSLLVVPKATSPSCMSFMFTKRKERAWDETTPNAMILVEINPHFEDEHVKTTHRETNHSAQQLPLHIKPCVCTLHVYI